METKDERYLSEFFQHESMQLHIPIEREFNDYIAIAEGNLDYVLSHRNDTSFADSAGKGKLSENDLQNMRYHFVVAATLITRSCVSKGLAQEKAYNLSDFYIRKMDKCSSIPQIVALHNTMCYDFCNVMNQLKKQKAISKPVLQCVNYIYSNIHSRITVKELASHVNLSESYLSKVFSKEMGVSISEYITRMKVDEAKKLLVSSDYSLGDISNYLAFSSQSHFIQVFQKYAGITPHKYRAQNFRKQTEWLP